MIQKITPPRCKDCGCRTERVIVQEGHEFFLCASCEYLRAKPDAPRSVKSERLQVETLF